MLFVRVPGTAVDCNNIIYALVMWSRPVINEAAVDNTLLHRL